MKEQLILRVESYFKQFEMHEQGKTIPSSCSVNLKVYSGKLTALIRPTGAGKSTVLKGIYRTYLPTTGRLWYLTKAGQEIDLAGAANIAFWICGAPR